MRKTEEQKLRDDLERASEIVTRAGDWVQTMRGLDSTAYADYQKASEGIDGLLSAVQP